MFICRTGNLAAAVDSSLHSPLNKGENCVRPGHTWWDEGRREGEVEKAGGGGGSRDG